MLLDLRLWKCVQTCFVAHHLVIFVTVPAILEKNVCSADVFCSVLYMSSR